MATEPILTIEVDWASKSGSADATVGFGETFDLRLTGFGDAGVNGNLWLTLIQDSVPSVTSVELWAYKTPAPIQSDADGVVTIDNLCIATDAVLEVLRSQGGKSRLYLAIREMRNDDTAAIDYGIIRLTVTVGSYIKDPSIPAQIAGLPKYSEVKAELKNAVDAAESVKEEAKDLLQRVESSEVVNVANTAKNTAERAEQIAKGATYSKVFATEDEMKAWAVQQMALPAAQREVKVGDNLYIVDTNVPDYWWTGEDVGYAQLETGAVKIEVDAALSTSSTNPIQNKVITLELGKKAPSSHNHAVSDVNGLRAVLDGKTDSSTTADLAARVDVLDETKQDAFARQATVNNVGSLNPADMNSMANADNCNQYFQIGTLADWGISGEAVKLSRLTIFRRGGVTPCEGDHLWMRILRWNGSAWYVAYQANQYQVFGSYTNNGQAIRMGLNYVSGTEFIPTDERVIVCFTNNENSAATSALFQFGAKVVSSSVAMLASGQTTLPTSPNFSPGISAKLAMVAEGEIREDLAEVLNGKQDSLVASNGNYVFDGTLCVSSCTSGIAFRSSKFINCDGYTGLEGDFCQHSGSFRGHGWGFRDYRVGFGGFEFNTSTLGKKLCALVNDQIGCSSGGSDNGSFSGSGCNSVQVGYCALATGNGTVAIGDYARAEGIKSIAIGYEAYAVDKCQIMIGVGACFGDKSCIEEAMGGIKIGHGRVDSDLTRHLKEYCIWDPIVLNANCTNVFFGFDDEGHVIFGGKDQTCSGTYSYIHASISDIVNRGGSSVTVDDALSDSSENPVQNKVVKAALDEKPVFAVTSGSMYGDGNGFKITDSKQSHIGAYFNIDNTDGVKRPHLIIQTATNGWNSLIPTFDDINAIKERVAALEAKLGTAAASVVSGGDDLL